MTPCGFDTPFFVYKLLVWAVSVLSVLLGVWLIVNPKGAVDFQIAAYRKINWKMEPLNWDRELRSTRLMGALAVICGVLATLFMAFKCR